MLAVGGDEVRVGPAGSKVVKRISGMLEVSLAARGFLVPRADPERRRAAVERLHQLRGNGNLTAAQVRLAASKLGVTEQTVWGRLSRAAGQPRVTTRRTPYQFSEAVREACTCYPGNVAAMHRATLGCAGLAGRAEFVRLSLQ
jgi:hypothetical protein